MIDEKDDAVVGASGRPQLRKGMIGSKHELGGSLVCKMIKANGRGG